MDFYNPLSVDFTIDSVNLITNNHIPITVSQNSLTISKGKRESFMLSFLPLKEGTLCIKGI